MNQNSIVIEFSEPLCRRIEDLLQQHNLNESLEDFIQNAGRTRLEQLQPRYHASDEPMTSQEKTMILKGLATEFRKLRNSSQGGIQ